MQRSPDCPSFARRRDLHIFPQPPLPHLPLDAVDPGVTMHVLFPSLEGFMTSCRISPPWEFLLSASRNSLQSYELSRLSHASNLRKEITALVDQWVEENSSAML